MKISVCLPALFGARPLTEALAQIHEAGASTFELWGWSPEDADVLLQARADHDLRCLALCATDHRWNDANALPELLTALEESLRFAQKVGAPYLLAQVGQEIPGVPRELQVKRVVMNLQAATHLLERYDISLLIEPLNTVRDHIGYLMPSSTEAFEVTRLVDHPQVRVLFDIYHQQLSEGNILGHLLPNLDLVGHLHIAGIPGRHEPFHPNELDYPYLLQAIHQHGYDGYVGLEYFPQGEPLDSLRQSLDALRAPDAPTPP